MGDKKDARELQRYTGARYTSCLHWVRTLRSEGLVKAEHTTGTEDRTKALRVALHKRFPDIEVARDAD